MEKFYYYGRFKNRNKKVAQSNVAQMNKVIRFRASEELNNKLNNLAEELGQNISKVSRDIMENFFLDLEQTEWQKEIAEWK